MKRRENGTNHWAKPQRLGRGLLGGQADDSLEGEDIVSHPPTVNLSEIEVEALTFDYPDAPPNTFVISGPLPEGGGPGRHFPTVAAAEAWVLSKYGSYVKRIYEAEAGGRWAFRVKPIAPQS